jgi:hypothetical protein
MRAVLGILIVSVASAALGMESATALTCMHSSFEEQIERARLIFVGTVESDTCVWVPCTPGGTDTCTIVTKYRFDRVTYLKGHGPPDSLVLMQEGGVIGNDGIYSSGEVRFVAGSRYIVLAGHHRFPGHYTASPCWMAPFGIWPDSGRADAVVHLGEGPLIAFDGTHFVGLHARPWSPDLGTWTIDETGTRHPQNPPPRRPLPELLRASDEDLRSRLKGRGLSPDQVEEVAGKVRTVYLFSHQDPGIRVSEAEFLKTLAALIARVDTGDKTK